MDGFCLEYMYEHKYVHEYIVSVCMYAMYIFSCDFKFFIITISEICTTCHAYITLIGWLVGLVDCLPAFGSCVLVESDQTRINQGTSNATERPPTTTDAVVWQ